MPTKITYPDGFCDGLTLAASITEQIVDLSEYKNAHLRFDDKRKGTKPIQNPPVELVAFANFRPSDLIQLANTPNTKFVRVFNGVRASGVNPHFMFIVAVDSNEKVINSIVLENCCQCPPRCIPPQGGF